MITGDRTLASGKRGAFYNTLEELCKHFAHIDIICPRLPLVPVAANLKPFPNVLMHPSPWPLIFQWFWISRKGVQIFYDRYPKPYSIVVVHEYSPVFNGVGARMLHRRTGAPFLLEVMHIPGVPRASGLWERINKWLTRMFIASESRRARAVRVINEHQTPDFLASAGVPQEKLMYSPAFYIDLDTFRPADTEKKYELAFVGRLSRNKGLDIFLDVVRQTGLNAVVVGDGPLLKSAKLQANIHKLPIEFVGFAKDSREVSRYLNESRILLMPSLNEGGPRVVLEALACGVPVVATPVGIVPEVLPSESIGDWSAGNLAGKIRGILSDSELYGRLRTDGLRIVRKFERRDAIAAYANILKNLAQ